MADAPVRIGVLGAARIVPGALVAPAQARDDIRLVAVAARDPDRARTFAAQHGFDGYVSNYAQLIARDDIDLVYIALPPSLHREWAIAALDAGKAVLCEKPFAMNAAEARDMVDAAQRTGGVLIEAFHYCFHRLMRDACALIADGAIGTPLTARASVEYPIPTGEGEPRWSNDLGGGALMDLGCYGIHALRSLLRCEPEVIAAQARIERGVDAATDARLRFATIDAEFHAAMDPTAPATDVSIEGSEGRIDINGLVLPQRSGRLRLTCGATTREMPIEGPSSYAAQLDHVAAVLRGREAQITGGLDAVANMSAIDAIKAACAAPRSLV